MKPATLVITRVQIPVGPRPGVLSAAGVLLATGALLADVSFIGGTPGRARCVVMDSY